MKDTFIVYTSYLDRFAKLTDEQLGRLFRMMLEYQATGIEPQIDDMALAFCFDVVKYDMDENNRKYEEMCERQRANVQKRWDKRNTNDTTVYHGIPPYTTDTKHTDNDNDTDTDNDTVSDSDTDSVSDNGVLTDSIKKEDAKASKKEVRHKYGLYDNVLLSDTDMEKLKAEFPTDWEERIERLSEYIESKGAKYKNHLATIRAWARKNNDRKKQDARPYAFRVIDEMDFGEGGIL